MESATLIRVPVPAISRRSFLFAGMSTALIAAPNPGYYRLERVNAECRIVAPDGAPLEHAPEVSGVPQSTPFLAAVPLIPASRFADVFDSAFQTGLRARCAESARSFRHNRLAVAYVFTSVPVWGREWVSWVRALDAEADGKQQYLQFLKQTYSYNIDLVDAAYGVESTSFTDLASYRWTGFDTARPAVRKDDEAFLGWIAQVLCATAVEALRKHDSNHLILGQPFGSDVPDDVVNACAPALDAVWLDPSAKYPTNPGKPVLRFKP
jgi:hypothetical protein